MPPTNVHVNVMRSYLSAAFAFPLVLAFCDSGAEQAFARSKRHSAQPVPSMVVDDTGTPIIMQGLPLARRVATGRRKVTKEATKETERHVHIPHGSPGFIPPISSQGPLPRTPLIGQAPATARATWPLGGKPDLNLANPLCGNPARDALAQVRRCTQYSSP